MSITLRDLLITSPPWQVKDALEKWAEQILEDNKFELDEEGRKDFINYIVYGQKVKTP